MSMIVFSLSPEASEFVRAYCAKNGSSLDGLACSAVKCLMDLLDDEWGGPWLPQPDGLAKGVDTLTMRTSQDGDDPARRFAAQITEAVLCNIAGTETSWQAEARRHVEWVHGTADDADLRVQEFLGSAR